jgi:flagellar export protein FliJ
LDKLHKVLRVRVQAEQDSASILAQSQQAKAQAEDQQQQLNELTAEYRRQHGEAVEGSVHRFRQFQLFYSQLSIAVAAQREIVAKLTVAEDQHTADFMSRHRDRRALEELLQQRDLAHKTERLKAERRAHIQARTKPMV